MLKRNIQASLLEALRDSPVVFLNGARQTGKSTLVQSLVQSAFPATYFTFDDLNVLAAAKADPAGFLRNTSGSVALDEVQRVPELFVAIKAEVDRSRKARTFLLIGSANVLFLPKLAESLAGRMEILTLWPFSQGEIEGRHDAFIKFLFGESKTHGPLDRLSRGELIRKITQGGYPEMLARTSDERRASWFGAYVTTILQRDVRDLARIEGLTQLPKALSMFASRAGQLINIADVANNLAIPQTSLKRYLTLLQTTYLVYLLPAWSTNIGKRLIKTPKLFLCDPGLLVYLLGSSVDQLSKHPTTLGFGLENFVLMELLKQASWCKAQPSVYHFRTLRGQEVDIVLEDRKGRIVGAEVKASASVVESDFKNLKVLSAIAGKAFHRGVVLYTGSDILPFGKNLQAIPVQALWGM